MRKYILGLLLIFWGICGGQAQTEGRYKMTWSTGSIDKGRLTSPPAPIVRYINASENRLPKKLEFWSKRTWRKFLSDDSRSGSNVLSLGTIPPYLHLTTSWGDNGDDLFILLETTLTLEIIPVSIKVHYYVGDGQGRESALRLLPDNDEITLKATKGYVPATYRWQYQVAGESAWRDVSSRVRYSEANSAITFRGTDLFSQAEFNSLIETGKNVLFRINAITEEHRDEANYERIVLSPPIASSRSSAINRMMHPSGSLWIEAFAQGRLWLSLLPEG